MDRLSETLVHVDEHLIIFDKPAGLLCVPGRGADKQDCLSARAQAAYPDALVVHRLDMATSGLCLMARGAAMQRALSAMFADREIDKCYEAIVAGHPQPPEPGGWSLIDLPIAADWPNRPLQIIDLHAGKPSQTRWRLVGREDGNASRLELEPLTGRTHQLRVHMNAIGHPILGDALYARPDVQALAPRLLLHARELAFLHPGTGIPVRFSSPTPF
ncbi:RluA family pseudouridine synthase [Caenimonas sp. SL110]|uniref:RluA family pseudouridine synthase n=1 Tax=Caenimonas sp. SL110 TaxID=1450524 RepID=UPI00128E0525|nr:pseudouridine synthase [Caenimonas sp. SL110]